jgi:hypothetical protein
MAIVYQRLQSLSEIDLDTMFFNSLDLLDANFFSLLPQDISFDDKKSHYLVQLQSAIDNTWPLKNDTDTFMMFKGVVDGIDGEFAAGYVDAEGAFTGRWYLTSPDSTGSRNWFWQEEAKTIRHAMYAENGVTKIKMPTFLNSQLYTFMKNRVNSGLITQLEEYPTVADPNPLNLVTLVFEV